MISQETIRNVRESNAVEIVWRNPARLRPHPRRHMVESAGQEKRYVLQEFVYDGYIGHWATFSNLEILAGGRAA